jgi:hypothetical protein
MNEETPLPDSTPPIDFPVVTSLQMAAGDLHEMYLSLLWAGFAEKQALHIIGMAVAGGMLSPYVMNSKENKDYEEESDSIDFDDDEDSL